MVFAQNKNFYIGRCTQSPSNTTSEDWVFLHFKVKREFMFIICEIINHVQISKWQANVLYLSCPGVKIDLYQAFFFFPLESIPVNHRFKRDFSKQVEHQVQRKVSTENLWPTGGMIITVLRSQRINMPHHNNNSGIELNKFKNQKLFYISYRKK